MTLDPVLTEVRRVREEYARRFDGDVRKMMEDLRRRHAESNRESVSREPKRLRQASPEITEGSG